MTGITGQALHCKLNNHRADIMHKRMDGRPMATHFNNAGHLIEDMSVMVIEKLWKDDLVLCHTWITFNYILFN